MGWFAGNLRLIEAALWKRIKTAHTLYNLIDRRHGTWRSGAPPEVDLRPRWSRLLQTISVTAGRTAAAEALETLRLEADAALIRATGRLAAR